MPVTSHAPADPTVDLLTRAGHSVGRVVRTTSEGDMGDGKGAEILFTTDDRRPQPMVARVRAGSVLEVTHGW